MDEFNIDYWTRSYSMSIDTVDTGSDTGSGSDSDSDSDSSSDSESESTTKAAKRIRRIYRPKSERERLEKLLCDWRLKIRAEDPTTMFFPLDDTLPSKSITQLARFKPEELETSSASSITNFLGESEEWGSIYAPEVYDIISKFNATTLSRTVKTIKKPKRTQPQHEFMGVIDFGTQQSSGRALKRRKTFESDNSAVASSSRTPLGELSVNKVSSLLSLSKSIFIH